MEIPFQINKNGETIVGIINMPLVTAPRTPVILMLYGFNGERVDNNRLAVKCARHAEKEGIIFVRFDYRGLGVSEGEFWKTSLDSKVQDAYDVLEYVHKMIGKDIKLMVLGFSDGVRIATKLLQNCFDIEGICMWSPVLFPYVDEVHGRIRRKFYREPFTNDLVVPHRGLWVGQDYLRQISRNDDSYDVIKNFDKPIMAVFGGNDPTIVETRSKLKELTFLKSQNICVHTILEADHLYSNEEWIEEICLVTVQWGLALGE